MVGLLNSWLGRLTRFARNALTSSPKNSSDVAGIDARIASPFMSARPAFISAAVFSGAMNLLMLSGSIFMLQVYDRVLPSRSIPTLQALCVLVVVLYGSFALLETIRNRLFARIGARLDALWGSAIFESNLRRGLPGQVSQSGSPFRDLEQVRGFLASGGPAVLFDLPWTPLFLGLLFLLHPWLGVVGLAGTITLAAIAWRTERATAPVQQAGSRATVEASTWAEASRRGAEALVPMGMSATARERWLLKNQAASAATVTSSDVSGAYGAFSKFVRMSLQSVILAVGAYLVIAGDATGGVMIASSILLGRALAPVELAIGHWRGFVAARQSYGRLREITRRKTIPKTALPPPRAKLDVENLVIMGAGEQRPRLRGLHFSLQAGDALGVVGPSGAGKSTLVRALVGLLESPRGSIRFDGSTIDQWNEADLASIIGYLPQDVELLPGSVSENISRFEEQPDPELILAAAVAAGADQFIRSLPKGFDTILADRGAGISIGERQRIALARALYRSPFLVVLDEPNSALDAEGEAALRAAIVGIRKRGGIVMLIAHRPSTLQAVNKVLVLEKGHQTQFGAREEVVAKLTAVSREGATPVAKMEKAS